MDTLVLIAIYRDFLCYSVYRPQGCNELEFYHSVDNSAVTMECELIRIVLP